MRVRETTSQLTDRRTPLSCQIFLGLLSSEVQDVECDAAPREADALNRAC